MTSIVTESKAATTTSKEVTTFRADGTPSTGKRLRVQLRPINKDNIGSMRVLIRAILPVTYKDKFYRDLMGYPEGFRQLAYRDANVVGAVCCRIENDPACEEDKRLYIMIVGVLAAYRGLQVGTQMLEHVLDQASKYHHEIKSVYLHVQTSNDDAVNFYKKFGFEIIETLPNYYTKVEPASCYVLSRANTPVDPPPEIAIKKIEPKKK
jgi:ribosomal protein S18 acetylase RimI-like enzyme